MSKAKQILVTGGNGFVGINLLNFFSKKYSVSALVRREFQAPAGVKVYTYASYTDDIVKQAVRNADIIIHCAAMIHGSYTQLHRANVEFTRTLVELANKEKNKHVIFLSSENLQHQTTDIYTLSKAKAEKIVHALPKHTIFRPTVIYGPHDTRYVGKLITLIKKSPCIPMIGSGHNTFQFIHVHDLAKMIESSITHKIYGTYVAAGPTVISYRKLIDMLQAKLKTHKPVISLPISLLIPAAFILDKVCKNPPLTPGQLKNIQINRNYDISSNIKIFKYHATSLEQGVDSIL